MARIGFSIAFAMEKKPASLGWIMICLPEVPFTLEGFIDRVAQLLKKKKSLVIAGCQGIQIGLLYDFKPLRLGGFQLETGA